MRRRSLSRCSIVAGKSMTMAAMDPAVWAAYEACRRLHRRHDPTYYWATRRLPAPVRPATHALYGYVRTADEIVDGPARPPTPGERRAALDAWEEALRPGLRAGPDPHMGRAPGLHGRLGGLGRPDHGRAARRARAPPCRVRAPRPGL